MSVEVETMEAGKKSGFKLFKWVGIAALIGVAIAVTRMVFRTISGKSGEETHEGV